MLCFSLFQLAVVNLLLLYACIGSAIPFSNFCFRVSGIEHTFLGFLLYNCFLSFFKALYITILNSYTVVKTGKCMWLYFSGHISKDSLWFAECVEPAIPRLIRRIQASSTLCRINLKTKLYVRKRNKSFPSTHENG